MIRPLSLLITPVLIIFASSWSEAKNYRLSEEAKRQIRKSGIRARNHLDLTELNQLIKDIATKNEYDSIKAYLKADRVYLDLRTASSTNNIDIIGNQALTRQEILHHLGVHNKTVINKYKLQKNIKNLERKYRQIGLLKVTVELKEIEKDEDTQFIIEINEGRSSRLTEIIVLSANSYLNRYIKSQVQSQIGKTLDDKMIKSIYEKVNKTLLDHRALAAKISNISPVYNTDRTESKLTITLENTTTYEFLFYGNSYYSSGNIISSLDLDKNYLNFIKNKKLFIKYIQSLYRESGFPYANIRLEEKKITKLSKTVLKFKIREGEQIKIKNIRVLGKISRPSGYYEHLLSIFLTEEEKSRFFIEKNLSNSLGKLISSLKNEGYLRAEKISIDYKFEGKKTVDVIVQINEGLLTQIRSIRFTGLKNFTSNQLFDTIDLQPNSPLNLNKVLASYEALKTFYQKNGYLDFKITSPKNKLISYLENYEFADINYEFSEGPQVIIKNILARGNKKTKSKVIYRELDLKPGDILTSENINDSILYIERTQLFSKAQINTSDVGTNIAERTVYIDVQEKNPGLFSAGVGISNERELTYRSFAGLSYKNLGGTGRGLSARLDAKYSNDKRIQYLENRLVIGYYEPYLYLNRLRLRTSYLHEEEVFAITENNGVSIQENNQVRLFLEKQINRHLKFTWNIWDLSILKTFNKDLRGDRTSVHIATIGPILEYERRDDIFSPKSGSYSVAQVDYSAPFLGSTNDSSYYINYLKATASHTLYTPLTTSKRWTWVQSFRGGYIKNLSQLNQSGVPATEAFFLGGRSTIRGFDVRDNERTPPLADICNNITAGFKDSCGRLERFRVTKDSHYFLYKSEVRFPLMGSLAGVIFYDGGSVYINGGSYLESNGNITNQDINIKDHYRDSLGVGLRFETPVGAFTAEIGFKLDRRGPIYGMIPDPNDSNNKIFGERQPAEDPFAIHISMGTF